MPTMRAWPAEKVMLFALHLTVFPILIACSEVLSWASIRNVDSVPAAFFLFSAVGSAGCLIGLLLSDPGVVCRPPPVATAPRPVAPVTLPFAGVVQCDYCDSCEAIRPLRAKHCLRCNFCVHTFDHHCWWADKCIGGNNRPWFLGFLAFEALLLWVGLTANTLSLRLTLSGGKRILLSWWTDAPLYLTWIAFLLATIPVTSLFLFHWRCAVANRTSLEIYKPAKCHYLDGIVNPEHAFNSGWETNLRQYFISKPREWSIPSKEPAPPAQGSLGLRMLCAS
eukprot:TRINITY_DN58231_c0_g1_i1.p1 TRINITY_DN58231_c0_g1~~TRINITY_DN58231_c0_g1_i1.p1  ORF type:complete len:280 (+),score=25.75 TRINITY_DN58231_c0_g1_i1:36-875(+)